MLGKETLKKEKISVVDMKAILSKRKKESELNVDQEEALKYVKKFSLLTPKNKKELLKELKSLGFSDAFIYQILDTVPKKLEDLVALIPKKEKYEEEKLKKTVDLVNKHAG